MRRAARIRPAPGYPACPDHTEKEKLWKLLDAEIRAGMSLTESFAMLPAASVSGWYFAHPDAQYFGVGQIGRDQLRDYAFRKGMPITDAERWLAPRPREAPTGTTVSATQGAFKKVTGVLVHWPGFGVAARAILNDDAPLPRLESGPQFSAVLG